MSREAKNIENDLHFASERQKLIFSYFKNAFKIKEIKLFSNIYSSLFRRVIFSRASEGLKKIVAYQVTTVFLGSRRENEFQTLFSNKLEINLVQLYRYQIMN